MVDTPDISGTRPAKHVTHASEVVRRGPKFNLRTDQLSLPGRPTLEKDIIEHPGSVTIAPFSDDGSLLLIEQWRPAVGKYSIELPSGTREPGEDERVTAQRELREEAGVSAGRLVRVGGFYPVTGYSSEYCAIYIAQMLTSDPLAQDKLEDIRVIPMPTADIWKMVADNTIDDALTVAALTLIASTRSDLLPMPVLRAA